VSLQSRLFTFFFLIVVMPLALLSLAGQKVIGRELERRTFSQLNPAQRAAIAVYEQKVVSARDRAQLIASGEQFQSLLTAKKYGDLQNYLNSLLTQGQGGVDYIVVGDASGNVLAEALSKASFLPGVKPPAAKDVIATGAEANSQLLGARGVVPITSGNPPQQVATVVGGYYLDNKFVEALSEATAVDATVFFDSRAISSTLRPAQNSQSPVTIDLTEAGKDPFFKPDIAGEKTYAVAGPLASDMPLTKAALVMSTSQAPVTGLKANVRNYLIVLLFLATMGTGLLAFLLARAIAKPLHEVAAGANAIAAGHYDQHIEVKSRDEVGQLARSFNEMAEKLTIHISELRESREELKRALTRFGETLRSTHDLERMLQVVLETSADTLRAQRGALMWMTPARDALVLSVGRGVDGDDYELLVGEGVTGYVAESGNPVRLPDGDGAPQRSPNEPSFRTSLSVPVFSQERVIAVLNLYDKEEGLNFTEADMGTLLSLADQAGVAIENVLLHREAQRLSITDGLTGIWNHRYFQMQFDQEMERSARFRRPFSIIVIDIDNFKTFNDTYGHLRGDSVLIELARRMRLAVRDIDVLARYGGEEFVLILPETDAVGGMRTAEKIRSVIAETAFGEDEPINVTVSVGVACFPQHGADRTTLLKASDKAMYEAKARGKNRVVLFEPGQAA
jgi:diguanylate cyclase (GGDEF)-like protein